MKIIYLKKQGYDAFIDYLKGVSIFFVVLTHCLPLQEYIGFCLWGAQAVPLFLILQTFHVYKKGMDEATTFPSIKKLLHRIIFPFCLLLFIQISISFLVFGYDLKTILKSAIVAGGMGPGSYYVWIYLQFVFLLPFIASIYKILINIVGVGKLSFFFIIANCLIELLCSYVEIPAHAYRLLALRYLFLIHLGYLWVTQGIILNRITMLLSILSMVFILLLQYSNINFEPIVCNSDWLIFHWMCYFYVAYLFVFFLKWIYGRLHNSMKVILYAMGKYSYEIFLMQMFVFSFWPYNMIRNFTGNSYITALISVIGTMTFSIIPVLGWKRVIWLRK